MSGAIYCPDASSKKRAVEHKGQMTTHQAYGPMQKFVPVLAAKKRDFDEMQTAIEAGDRPMEFNFALTLFAKDADAATRAVSNAETCYGSLMFAMLQDRYFALPLFLQALPFGASRAAVRDSFRYKTMATRHALPLLPLMGDWKGTGSPLVTFISRNGQVMGSAPSTRRPTTTL